MPTRINPFDGRAANRRWIVAVLMALALLVVASATALADDAGAGDPVVVVDDPAPPPATDPEPVDDGTTTPPPPASGEEDPGTTPVGEPADPVTPVDPPVDPAPVDEAPVVTPPPAAGPAPTTDGQAVVAPPPSGPDKPPARAERETTVLVAAAAVATHTEATSAPAAPVLAPVPGPPTITPLAPRVTTRRAVAKDEAPVAAAVAPLPAAADPPPAELLLTPARGRVTVDDLAPVSAAPQRTVQRKPVAPPPAPRRHREEVATPTGLAAFITASPSEDSASPSLLDTLASRFVPGIDGGATLPTSLLIILELVLVGLLALPRAPRRVGHIVETAWHPLEGVHSRPARPG